MKILIIAVTATDTSGYGLMTNGFLDALEALKIDGKVHDIVILNQQVVDNPEQYDMTITVLNPGAFTDVLRRNPMLYQIYKDTPRNAFNVIFETDKLPMAWDAIFNLDFITDYIVQSKFMEAQVKARTDRKIWTITPAVDENKITRVPTEERLKESKFRVITIGQWTVRKGLLDAVVAFTRELGGVEDAEMIVKYNLLSKNETDASETFASAVRLNSKPGTMVQNVTAIASRLEYSDVINLYKKASVLLISSRGEGFGIPPVEAMLAGTPVIYTNWSALPEVCDLPGNYSIDYYLDEAHGMSPYGYENGLQYAVPLISSTMKALRMAYEKWKSNRESYYQNNRDIMIERYGSLATIKQMELFINGETAA